MPDRKQATGDMADELPDGRSDRRLDEATQLGENLGIGEAAGAAGSCPLLDVLAVGQAGRRQDANLSGRIEGGQNVGDL